jgi:hypothetical protein
MTKDEIYAAIKAAEADRDAIRDKLHALRHAYRLAVLAEARAEGHPWLGKKVKRTVHHWRGERTTTGTVKLCEEARYGYQRGHSPSRGEFFVESDSGKTAYDLSSGKWELVE